MFEIRFHYIRFNRQGIVIMSAYNAEDAEKRFLAAYEDVEVLEVSLCDAGRYFEVE